MIDDNAKRSSIIYVWFIRLFLGVAREQANGEAALEPHISSKLRSVAQQFARLHALVQVSRYAAKFKGII